MAAGAPEFLILRWLARRDGETASTIGAACRMVPGEIQAYLGLLEGARFVSAREDGSTIPPRRVYLVTAEGRSALGVGNRSLAQANSERLS